MFRIYILFCIYHRVYISSLPLVLREVMFGFLYMVGAFGSVDGARKSASNDGAVHMGIRFIYNTLKNKED